VRDAVVVERIEHYLVVFDVAALARRVPDSPVSAVSLLFWAESVEENAGNRPSKPVRAALDVRQQDVEIGQPLGIECGEIF